MAAPRKNSNDFYEWEEDYSEERKRSNRKAQKPKRKDKTQKEEGGPRKNLKKQKEEKMRDRDIQRMMRNY